MVPSDLCPGCLQQVVRPVEQSQPPLMFGNRCLNSGQLLLLRLTVVINLGQCDSVPETVKLLSAVCECLRQLGPVTRAEKVAYGTSADVSGDTSRVVGYAGMLFA